MSRELDQLRAEVRALSARLDQRPLQTAGKRPYTYVQIVSGNILSSGGVGVLYEDPFVTSVPSAYDPNVTSSFVDGIGRGTLFINAVAQAGYVLVVNDNRGSFRNAVTIFDVVWVGDPVLIDVDGGGTIQAYPFG